MDRNAAKHTLVKVFNKFVRNLGQKSKMSGRSFLKWEWRFFITQNGIALYNFKKTK
jgi:hypothetical protein